VDQCTWGYTETATSSDVNKMQELEDGEERVAGPRTATEVHIVGTEHIMKICLRAV
jgi:hypothetical protein